MCPRVRWLADTVDLGVLVCLLFVSWEIVFVFVVLAVCVLVMISVP